MFSKQFYLEKFKIISGYVINQGVVQLLTAIAGLLAVRFLSKTELAYFTIASSIQTALLISSDLGVTTAVQAMGGRNWNNNTRLNEIISTAYSLRKYLVIASTVLIFPLSVWLLYKNGAPASYIVIILSILFVDWVIKVRSSFLGLYFRIISRLKDIKELDLFQNILRTSLIVLFIFLWFNSISILLAGLITTVYVYFSTVRRTKNEIHLSDEQINVGDRKEILQIIKSQTPYFLFYVVQGQITIWLVSLFGNVDKMADLGAITRLAMILSVVSNVYSVIIGPAFSRCKDKTKALHIFGQSIAVYIFIALFFILITALFPQYLLMIVGDKYNYLQRELLLMVCATMLSSLTGVVIALNNAKGWMKQSWLIIPATVLFQALAISILDLHELRNIILFNLISNLPTLLVYLYMTRKGFKAFSH
jgi:O-antigen/teichoic acid export membrane protein